MTCCFAWFALSWTRAHFVHASRRDGEHGECLFAVIAARPGQCREPEVPRSSQSDGGGHYAHMGSLFSTVLTSAFVALAVEWLAKPRLEARKERLLALYRARRAFEKNLLIILGNAAKLATGAANGIPRGTDEELRRAIRAEADRAASQIDAATKDMSDNVMDYVLTYSTDRIRNLIIRYVFTTRGISISSRTRVEKAEMLKEVTAPINTWLFARRRLIARARAFTELPKILDKYSGIDRDNGVAPHSQACGEGFT